MRWSAFVVSVLMMSVLAACDKPKPAAAPPLEVGYVEAVSKDVAVSSEWIGTTQGLVSADIRPKVQGYLLKQNYQDGTLVRAGQQLYQIDPSQYQASLATAQGELGKAKADLGRATLSVDIYGPLAKKGAVSQLEYLDAVQQQKSAEASVASAEGNLQQARLNLAWTKVTSLIDGMAGISQAKVGDLVSPSAVMTTVATLDPIKIEFPISEQQYLLFGSDAGAKGTDARFAHAPPLEITLANGVVFAHAGKFKDLGLGVDQTTGTIKVQGLFPNPGGVLRPGQFVRVRAVTQNLANATLVPQRAIVDQQGSNVVAIVVGTDGFTTKPVKTGPLVGSDQVILDGVKPGDKVIVDGLSRLRPGEKIVAKPSAAKPAAASAPPAAATPSAIPAAPKAPPAAMKSDTPGK